MIFEVHTIKAGRWSDDSLSIFRSIELETTIGARRHEIAIAYSFGRDGGLHCLLMFYVNFKLALHENLDGGWLAFTLQTGDEVALRGALRCKEDRAGTSLVTDDPDTIKEFIVAMMTPLNWKAEVLGRDGGISFPLPADPTFKNAFANVQARLKDGVHAQN